jgi:hypothetical protein
LKALLAFGGSFGEVCDEFGVQFAVAFSLVFLDKRWMIRYNTKAREAYGRVKRMCP